MEQTMIPLWPDGVTEQHFTCWNCGKRQLGHMRGQASRFMCECGCGWSRRFNVTVEQERGQFEFREKHLARQSKTELVDFTKPGALSSPA